MTLLQSNALTLTIVLGLEYWLKQCWESLFMRASRPFLSYIIYRLFHLSLLAGGGLYLFAKIDPKLWMIFSTITVLVGCLEIPLTMIRVGIHNKWEINVYQINYIIPVLLVVLSGILDLIPLYHIDYKMIFLVIILAEPTNYMIRWALNKGQGYLVGNITTHIFHKDKLGDSAEVAATATEEDAYLKVGRKIGILERWLILFLVASGNVASIGLVITAKSIVRYQQLYEAEFAEYYLFGTLLSVVIALASCFVVLGGI